MAGCTAQHAHPVAALQGLCHFTNPVPAMPALGRLSQPGARTALHALALPPAAPLQPLVPLSLPCTVARSSFCSVSVTLHARLPTPPTASLSDILSAPPSASCSSSPPSRHTIALHSPSTAYLGTSFLLCTRFRARNPPANARPHTALASLGRRCRPWPPLPPLALLPLRPPYRAPQKP